MATRSIVTSQPDIACDVCMRRLLRGERPDVFLAGGRRLTVCELCAPRAAHEGWLRERDAQAVNMPPARPRRGRGLLARLRGRGESGMAEQGAVMESAVAPAQMAVEGLEPVGLETFETRSPVEPVSARSPVEPVPARPVSATPVSAVSVQPVSAHPVRGQVADGAYAEAEHAEADFPVDEPVEEGSWRDAWMFVAE
ncbi:MAG TPA: hypothetical protein VMG80_04280 [Solirubrobacteraceae bacterium]|nr:hypothetical protein [Solirubrobacteraceae bacterium]